MLHFSFPWYLDRLRKSIDQLAFEIDFCNMLHFSSPYCNYQSGGRIRWRKGSNTVHSEHEAAITEIAVAKFSLRKALRTKDENEWHILLYNITNIRKCDHFSEFKKGGDRIWWLYGLCGIQISQQTGKCLSSIYGKEKHIFCEGKHLFRFRRQHGMALCDRKQVSQQEWLRKNEPVKSTAGEKIGSDRGRIWGLQEVLVIISQITGVLRRNGGEHEK